MKRLFVSIAILVFIVLSATASIITIHKSNEHLFELVQQTSDAYRSGGDTAAKLQELEDYWQGYYLLMTYITAAATMEDMSRSVTKLPYLLQTNSDDFLAELESIRNWAQLQYDSQFPDVSSIF